MTVRDHGWPWGKLVVTATFLGILLALSPIAHAQLRIVTYNTNFGPDPGIGTEIVFQSIGEELVNGIAKPIDVLLLQEQAAASGGASTTTADFLNRLNTLYTGMGVSYAMGNVTGGGDSTQSIIYRTQTVELLSTVAFGSTGPTVQPRQSLQYELKPAGYDNATFWIYNSHFKAGDSSSDEAKKNLEATSIRNRSDNILGQGAHVIYAGDYNFYTAGEDGFQTLIGAGNGQAVDPLGLIDPTPDGNPSDAGNWSQNADVAFAHTQSPCNSGCGSAGGNMDDRFDFQLVTHEFDDGAGLSIIPDSYHTFGNNGTTFNLPINHVNNTYDFGEGATYSQDDILNALATITDHVPVVADYQLPALMQAIAGTVPATLTVGQVFNLDVTVNNNAPVIAAIGADQLVYSLTSIGSVSGSFMNQVDMALGSGNTHFVTLDTATPGAKTGTITVMSNSQQVQHALFEFEINYEVLSGNEPLPPGPEVVAAKWTFETSQPAATNATTISNIASEVGTGTARGVHASSSTDYSNPVGNGSVESFSSNTWAVGDFYEFQISTEDYQDISISFDQTSSNTGPKEFGIFYSTTGIGAFTNTGVSYSVLANDTPNPVWSSGTHLDEFSFEFDLSALSALDDQATMFLRLVDLSTVSANNLTVQAGGTSRVDNFTIYYHLMPSMPGDFNQDGVVDAADYVVWRKTNSGDTGAYAIWLNNFGRTLAGSGGGNFASSNVPEPGTCFLLTLGICLLGMRRGTLTAWNRLP